MFDIDCGNFIKETLLCAIDDVRNGITLTLIIYSVCLFIVHAFINLSQQYIRLRILVLLVLAKIEIINEDDEQVLLKSF